MGRLRTVTILLTIGAWGAAATEGAPPDSAAPATEAAARPSAPVPPVRYLEAGAKLFNNGQYDMAAKYINAAQSYREQLSASEQTVLDAYLREMAHLPADAAASVASAPAPAAAESAVVPVPSTPASAPEAPATVASAPAADAPAVTDPAVNNAVVVPTPPPGADAKAKARWLLATAREQIRAGNYDDAAAKVAEARAMNVRWGLFDDTPNKVEDAIAKARPRALATASGDQTHDRKNAKARLKEARDAINAKQFEQAEAIAMEVKSWGLNYSMFEDTPDKVAAAARALRRRDAMRSGGTKELASQSVYDILVQESRQLMAAGQYDLAEEKAKKAQTMNIVPAVTADRAESVLHDLAMARARQPKGDQAVAVTANETPAPAEAPSVTAEREANELLSKGDKTAAAKFAEAEALRARETGQPVDVPVVVSSPETGEAAVRPSEADEPIVVTPVPEAPANITALPGPGQPPADTPAPAVNRGEQLLAEARALFQNGNFPAAKEKIDEVKAAKLGVDAQADDLLSQIALAEQGSALNSYEAALSAVRAGDVAKARALLVEVAAAGEGLDDGLRQKVRSLLDKLPKDDSGKATVTDRLDPADDADTLAAQKLNAEVGTKIAEARRLQETDPDKAIAIYEQTLKAVKAADIPDNLARPMVRRLEVASELAKKDKVTFDVKMKDKAYRAEIEQKRLRIFEAEKAKKDRMKDFMDKAQKAMSESKYEEAEAYAKRAQEVDPNEVAATMLVWKARVQRRYERDLQNKADKENGVVEAFQGVDAAAIADVTVQRDGIKYPETFNDLTMRRRRQLANLEPKKSTKTLAIESKLNEVVTLNMDKQPLGEAINFLQNYTGLNIVLDPKALMDENVTSASPVDLKVSNIRLQTALKLILKPLGLTWRIEDEVLLITSPHTSTADTFSRPYYVGDLVMPPGKPPETPIGMPTVPTDPSNPLGQSQIPNGMTAATGPNVNGVSHKLGERPNIDMTPLVQLITSSIAPGTWKVFDQTGQDISGAYGMGGGFGGGGGADGGIGQEQPIGSITPFMLSISLIIRHTAEIHEQVADLLKQLRRLQDLQVSIEVRFITVSDNFFEQIGVDFDFNIQSDAVGKHSTFAVANPAGNLFATTAGTTGGTTGGLTGGTTGGLSGGTTGGLSGGTTGGLSGGTTGGLSGGTTGGLSGGATGATGANAYLVNPVLDHALPSKQPVVVGMAGAGAGNFTSNLGIPFTQGSGSLAVPPNAQPGAGATFGIAFLSDLEVYLFLTAAQGDTRSNIMQAPKVTTFNGAAATIFNNQVTYYVGFLTPIVGAGAVAFQPTPLPAPTGVTLSVTPVVSADRRYVRMTLMPFFNAIQGFDTFTIPAAVGGALGGQGVPINGQIQLPRTTTTFVSTTVTVPDGGTVLLGGIKELNEQRLEFGVPILSKTPWINRLFRNVGIGRQTTSLMLMVTPRIVILEEEEEKLGIPAVAF